MKITKIKFLNLLVLFVAFLSVFSLVITNNINVAAGASDTLLDSQIGFDDDEIGKTAFGETGEPDDVRVIVARLVNVFLGFMGIVFVILILSGGYKWMTAGGNEENVNQAKSTITKAVIGLVIIWISWSIAEFTTNCLMDITGTAAFKWYCPN